MTRTGVWPTYPPVRVTNLYEMRVDHPPAGRWALPIEDISKGTVESLQVLFVQTKTCIYLSCMKFVDILGNARLWSVLYPGDEVDILTKTFRDWMDLDYLEDFFLKNIDDLSSYFNITDIDTAIYDTLDDAYQLRCLIMDISPDARLDDLFRYLENSRTAEMILGREKAKGKWHGHDSWLRLYALKVEENAYLITGGAIKLTHTMAERKHTLKELEKMERVRNFLLEQGATDIDGLKDIRQEDEKDN